MYNVNTNDLIMDMNQEEIREAQTECTSEDTTAQAATATEPQPELTDAEKWQQAEALLAAEQDKYLRKVAEFENFRKRTIKEKTELILNGGEKLMTALLPVIDDLDRASANLSEATDVEALREGLELVFGKLKKVLAEQGLKQIETTEQPFDTDYHEAIALIPAPTDELKGKIIDCVQPGYMLNDKVIRHARVAVGQ